MTHVKLRAVFWAAALAWMGSARPALGCSTCYGGAEGPMFDAARLGTLLMLGVVLFLQIAFAAFFLYLRRRAARLSRNAGGLQWSGDGPGPHGEWRSA
jgi:hypothetical protein